jgi:hypothetical protein
VFCPHCAHENPEGRKYCLACTKPLTAQPAAQPPAPVSASPQTLAGSRPSDPKLNKMAVASLVLGFFSLIPPLGIAAVAFGHVSRSQIAKSGGREKGTGIAFAGLILGYIQLAVLGIFFLGILGLIQDFRREMDKHPNTQVALAERIAHGDPYAVNPAKSARQQESAIQALHLIGAQETQYLAAHPDQGYACQLYQVGFDPAGNTELGTLMRESDYDTKFIRCSQINGPNYVVLSVPRSGGNPADAPVFCLDQANGIEKYTPEQSRNAVATIMTAVADPCPLTGDHVE